MALLTSRVASAWSIGRCMSCSAEPLSSAWGHVRAPMASRLPWFSRSAQDDLSGTCRKLIGVIFSTMMNRQWSLWCGTTQRQRLQVWNPRTTVGRCQRFNGERMQRLLWWQKRCWEWSNTNKDKIAKKWSEQWLWYHVRNTKFNSIVFQSKRIYMSAFIYEIDVCSTSKSIVQVRV